MCLARSSYEISLEAGDEEKRGCIATERAANQSGVSLRGGGAVLQEAEKIKSWIWRWRSLGILSSRWTVYY